MKEWNSFFFISLFFFFAACNYAGTNDHASAKKDTIPGKIEITAANIAGNFSTQSPFILDTSSLKGFFVRYPSLSPFANDMRSFYKGRQYMFAWHDNDGLIEQAGNLYNRLQDLESEGVEGKVPYIESLDSLLSADDATDLEAQSEADVLLTGMYFYFAKKVWRGLNEEKTRAINWYLPRKQIDYEVWLDSLLQTPGGFTAANEPVYRQYNLLKPFLSKYKSLQEQHKWQTLTAGKKSYRLGDSAAVLSGIRDRLYQLGDLKTAGESAVFDKTLEDGVKNFQHRFGMKEDGIIGGQLLRELNEPIDKRIQQITVNLERSRWISNEINGEYLAVNIPEFKLRAYKGDSIIWTMNVVVGKSVHKTVIFSGNVKYVVFSPYWNVPTSILKKEVLPGIKRNKNYLASHHMEWHGNSVRQKPGPWNSLGKVKFLFPNSFSIYLHDTPSKSLFNEDNRAFSHGCIRVAEPQKLAMYLLRNDPAWTEKRIVEAMNSGKEQYVTLKENIPVFIAYLTAWVDRKGNLNFRKDIYNRDSRLATMISN